MTIYHSILTCLLLLGNVVPDSSDIFYFGTNRIKIFNSIDFEKTSYTCIFFRNLSDCEKCISANSSLVECILSSGKSSLQFITVVECTRESDLKIFKNRSTWKYEAVCDFDSLKYKLGIPKDTYFAIVDSLSILRYACSFDSSHSICSQANKIVNNQ